MSAYLIIKKDGVCFGEWSRSSDIFRVLAENTPGIDECEFDPSREIPLAVEAVREEISEYDKAIAILEEVLKSPSLEYEDLHDTCVTLVDLREGRKDKENLIVELNMLQSCLLCDEYGTNKHKFTWFIG